MNIIIENHRHAIEDLCAYFPEKEVHFVEQVVEIYNQQRFPTLKVFANLIDDLEVVSDYII